MPRTKQTARKTLLPHRRALARVPFYRAARMRPEHRFPSSVDGDAIAPQELPESRMTVYDSDGAVLPLDPALHLVLEGEPFLTSVKESAFFFAVVRAEYAECVRMAERAVALGFEGELLWHYFVATCKGLRPDIAVRYV